MSTDTDTPLFHLLDPQGKEIMSGPMNILMELVPDTNARNAALEEAVHAAVEAVEAEERANEARAAAAQIVSDGISRLSTRMDSFEKSLAISQKRAEAEAQRRDRQRVAAMLDALPDPDAPDPTGHDPMDDDGELTIKHANEREDADPDPVPLGATSAPGATRDPGPDPGTIDYPPRPQTAPPTAISLNSDGA